jgi:hypothetical protein
VKTKINVDSVDSHHRGIKGLFEKAFRRFKAGTHVATMLPVYIFGCVVIGASLTPAIVLTRSIIGWDFGTENVWLRSFVMGVGLAAGFFTYGLTVMVVCPFFNWLLRCKLQKWRGPYYSAEAFKWYMHNAFTYLPRFTFLDFVTPSPLANLFFQMMGMKIGLGTVINSSYISDPSMITLGKKVTIGGSVTMIGHYGQDGFLVVAPVVIGDGCTIGLKASIMGGTLIGKNVKILPHSAVMPKTVIPDNEIWGGVPAKKIGGLMKTEESEKAA